MTELICAPAAMPHSHKNPDALLVGMLIQTDGQIMGGGDAENVIIYSSLSNAGV